ncbi:MAG: hypothetical protein ABSB49_01175 [Polyangia bacterium]
MRKLTGVCFLTAILLGSSAYAQSLFIERGDPSTMSLTLGGMLGNTLGPSGTVEASYSYRGVFDVGLEFGALDYKSGRNDNLRSLDFAPFFNWHLLRSEEDELPVSLSLLVAVEKVLYYDNGAYASPNGWGVLAGGTIYRRIELGSSVLFIPEVLIAYDFMYTRYYSNAQDQKAQSVGGNSAVNGYSTTASNSARGVLYLNVGFKGGQHIYTISPYGGYEGSLGSLGGVLLGFVF